MHIVNQRYSRKKKKAQLQSTGSRTNNMVKTLIFLDVNGKHIDAYYIHLSIFVSAFKFLFKTFKNRKNNYKHIENM